MTASLPNEVAVLSELKCVFPEHNLSLLKAIAKQHNFNLELAVANVLAGEDESEKPIKVRALRSTSVNCIDAKAVPPSRLSGFRSRSRRCPTCSSRRTGCARASSRAEEPAAGTLSPPKPRASRPPSSRGTGQHPRRTWNARAMTTAASSPAWMGRAGRETKPPHQLSRRVHRMAARAALGGRHLPEHSAAVQHSAAAAEQAGAADRRQTGPRPTQKTLQRSAEISSE